MIGTKVYARITGHLDAAMVLDELGEREVYRKTETLTSTANGSTALFNNTGTASQGWTKEKIGVVRQEELAELGPCGGGIRALVQGFGKDPILLTFPYVTTSPRRAAFIENLNFNKPLAPVFSAPAEHIVNTAPVVASDANTPAERTQPEHTSPVESSETPAAIDVHNVYNDSAEIEHSLIFEASESAADIGFADDYTDADLSDPVAEKGGEMAVEDIAADALGLDPHTLELAVELLEAVDENTSKHRMDIDVAAVVDAPENTSKRGLFRKRKQRVHGESIGFAEDES